MENLLVVENIVKKADMPVNLSELKKDFRNKITPRGLQRILSILESRNIIHIGEKDIVFIENNNPKFSKMIKNSKRVEL